MIAFLYMVGVSVMISMLIYLLIAIIIVACELDESVVLPAALIALTIDAVLTSVIMTMLYMRF